MNVLVTGAGGFLGRALSTYLVENTCHHVTSAIRSRPSIVNNKENIIEVGDITRNVEWPQILDNIDIVIHTAARAHVLRDAAINPLEEFRKVNVDATLHLAKHSIECGVKRFIFISSIGVCGSITRSEPFTENTKENPEAEYAKSKYEAEQALWKIFENTSVELVVIRPPLVYAHNAPGNFRALLGVIYKRIPLPFAIVNNKKSFIALDNLVNFIALCIDSPNAANELFVIADDESISTKKLIQQVGKGMHKKTLFIPVPIFVLQLGATIVNKKSIFQQLCSSLEVDNSKAKRVLGWAPVISTSQALIEVGEKYKKL